MSNSVYLITGPTGAMYVGITNKTSEKRWLEHVALSRRDMKNHPLRDAIRVYGPDAFTVSTLASGLDRESAKETEIYYIGELKTLATQGGYNVSRGGDYDFTDLNKRSWASIRRTAMSEAAYRKKLSIALQNCGRTDYSASILAIREWRLSHPEEWAELHRKRIEGWKTWAKNNPERAYLVSINALEKGRQKIADEPEWFRERLSAGIKKSFENPERLAAHVEMVKQVWRDRSPEEKRAISDKISKAKLKYHAESETEEDRKKRLTQLSEARKSIDHDLRKRRQKEALIAYWTPERRAEFSARRKAMALAKKEQSK